MNIYFPIKKVNGQENMNVDLRITLASRKDILAGLHY